MKWINKLRIYFAICFISSGVLLINDDVIIIGGVLICLSGLLIGQID